MGPGKSDDQRFHTMWLSIPTLLRIVPWKEEEEEEEKPPKRRS